MHTPLTWMRSRKEDICGDVNSPTRSPLRRKMSATFTDTLPYCIVPDSHDWLCRARCHSQKQCIIYTLPFVPAMCITGRTSNGSPTSMPTINACTGGNGLLCDLSFCTERPSGSCPHLWGGTCSRRTGAGGHFGSRSMSSQRQRRNSSLARKQTWQGGTDWGKQKNFGFHKIIIRPILSFFIEIVLQ